MEKIFVERWIFQWWTGFLRFSWYVTKDHSFSTYAKFSENISYPMVRTRTCVYHGVRNISFLENCAYLINQFHNGLFLLLLMSVRLKTISSFMNLVTQGMSKNAYSESLEK